MKGKIGSAMSRGLPVVTTLVGAEGMELRHEFDALVADTPRDFADSVIRLIRDDILWSDIASNAKATVMRTSSPQVVSGQLQQIMESLKP
jgi:glycosyltransferase involved in cell wall biosynthesis